MKQKKNTWIWIVLALLALLIIGISLWFGGCFGGGGPIETEPTVPSTEVTEPVTEPTTTEPVTEPTTEPLTDPVETTVPQKPTDPVETTKPPVYNPTTQPPETTVPDPSDPMQVLSLAKGKVRGLSDSATEVGSVSNPQHLSISVPVTVDAEAAAQMIFDKIKDALGSDQFDYEYNLSYVQTADGQHTFRFAYQFITASTEAPDPSYDTNRLVADVCAYLDSLGKTKFDSQSSECASKQPVIVLLEHPYETALSIVKAQVESISTPYYNYDFYFATRTVTTKGGVEKEALCFYIVNN